MNSDSTALICSALAILVLGYAILSRYLPTWAALTISIIKALVPLVYFWHVFPQSGWTLYDDVRYFDVGASLVQLGYRPWDLLFDPEGRDLLASAAASRHTLYYVWNVVAQSAIGSHYFSAVFFNIGLTYLAGAILWRMLRLLDFPHRFLQGLLALHMLHWDYLSWTSLINVKETLVETLILMSIYGIVRFTRVRSHGSLLWVAGSFFLLFSLRLYIPFLILTAVGVWLLLEWQDSRKYLLLPIVMGLLLWLYSRMGETEHQLAPHLMIAGGFRFLLTPQPWNITPSYSFLQIPMLLQWTFILPALVGAIRLWQQGGECRLTVIVLLAFTCFYAMFPDQQGPRHRVQLVALFCVLEYLGLLSLVGSLVHRVPQPHLSLEWLPSLR